MNQATTTQAMKIDLVCPAFGDGQMIPRENTCDGEDISPELQWAAVPDETRTLALIVDDPDAPSGTFVHWVLYNIPSERHELTENTPHSEVLPDGATQGVNDFGRIGYGGPCPPSGTHRYYFTLYALDTDLDLTPGITKAALLDAMNNHILARGQIMGRYTRQTGH
ncbi:MAG: YbhB/YbcL family Raf kinase inhibitor-like protein [Solirubrobacterales bacterium]